MAAKNALRESHWKIPRGPPPDMDIFAAFSSAYSLLKLPFTHTSRLLLCASLSGQVSTAQIITSHFHLAWSFSSGDFITLWKVLLLWLFFVANRCECAIACFVWLLLELLQRIIARVWLCMKEREKSNHLKGVNRVVTFSSDRHKRGIAAVPLLKRWFVKRIGHTMMPASRTSVRMPKLC